MQSRRSSEDGSPSKPGLEPQGVPLPPRGRSKGTAGECGCQVKGVGEDPPRGRRQWWEDPEATSGNSSSKTEARTEKKDPQEAGAYCVGHCSKSPVYSLTESSSRSTW